MKGAIKMKKISIYLALAAVMALVLMIFAGCDEGEIPEAIETEETVPIEMIDATDIVPVSKDQEIMAGNIEWEITKVEDLGTQLQFESGYQFKATVGKFISLEFDVTNYNEDTVILYDLRVIDEIGRVYTVCVPAYGYFTAAQACTVEELIPENTYEFAAPFDVSLNSEGLMLEVTDLKNPPEEKVYIDLGL